jgi:GNAT superfamily N-acetyltransferase
VLSSSTPTRADAFAPSPLSLPEPASPSAAAPARGNHLGEEVRIRRLTPADAPLLDRILDGMSPMSRYRRFHSPKPRLTSAERAYLAGADGRDHLALVALDAHGAPLGVARAVRLAEDPRAAELAVSVIDAFHRRGLGMELVNRLADDAAAVGIDRLVAVVLTDTWLGTMLERRGWHLRRRPGMTTVLELDVSRRPQRRVRRPRRGPVSALRSAPGRARSPARL